MTPIHFRIDSPNSFPKGSWIIAVVGDMMYESRGNQQDRLFECGESSVNVKLISELPQNASIYVFPTPIDAFKHLKSGGCLDKFLYKNEEKRKEFIKALLKSGKIVGFNSGVSKYRAHLIDDNICWESQRFPDAKENGETSNIGDKTWYQFDNLMELYTWIIRG